MVGKSILPKIVGPVNLSACILVIAPCTFSGAIEWSTGGAFGAGVGSAFFVGAFGAGAFGAAALGAGSSVLLADFFGLVEESIKERSILLMTFGASTSDTSTLTIAGAGSTGVGASVFTFEGAGAATGASAFGVSTTGVSATTAFFTGAISSAFLPLSATAFFGNSTWSALSLATLSLWNSACKA